MKSLCERCKDKSCYGYDRRNTECEDFQAMTNADRIRDMTDEELAAAFCMIAEGKGPLPNIQSLIYSYWLDWLQQEADNG